MNVRTTPSNPRFATSLAFMLMLGGCSKPDTTPPSPSSAVSPNATPATAPAAVRTEDQVSGGPGRARPDLFHPDNQPDKDGKRPVAPEPVDGGRVIVHLESMPRHLNYMTENSATAQWVLKVVHDFLLARDFNTWQHVPVLAKKWDVEDEVYVKGASKGSHLYGSVIEEGEEYVITPISAKNPLAEPRRVKKADVDRVEKGTVFTFLLRDDVTFHDGHPLTSKDVYFSWQAYHNPTVDCESVRSSITKITEAQIIDDHAIRFFYENQYFLAADAFTALTVLPSHVYNLRDKENHDFDAKADPLGRKQGQYINDNPHNVKWVGLGAYQVTEVNEQYIEAKRFPGYFDKAHAGHVDTIRWRHLPSDDAAKAALLNGELDYWGRLRPEDYYGEFTQKEEFTKNFYKGYVYLPRMQYIAWNMRRPQFQQKEVREALGHAFDWDQFIVTIASGLGVRVTGEQFFMSPAYDQALEPLKFDLDKARDLLTEAGWYDRDKDGIIDKDGVKFEIDYLMSTGNKAAETTALKLQENVAKLGIKVNIGTRDWAAFVERIRSKDFDAFGLAWALDVETDPGMLWQSYQGKADTDRGLNYPGVADPAIDALIGSIQRELDGDKRNGLFHQLQRQLYDMQPYMFTYAPPIKFAVSRRVRNFWGYGLNPGYDLRGWFLTDGGDNVAAGKQ